MPLATPACSPEQQSERNVQTDREMQQMRDQHGQAAAPRGQPGCHEALRTNLSGVPVSARTAARSPRATETRTTSSLAT